VHRPAAWAALGLVLPGTALAREAETVSAWYDHALELTARGVEAVGIGIIVLGALAASLHFAWLLVRSATPGAAYHAYRANLGRGILLGLEFLVAADIIGTVAVDPTLYNLGVLAAIVVIRTFLSFSLEAEIEGHWPWQRRRLDTTGEARVAPPPA
jgi:uncharacterized membrane protein